MMNILLEEKMNENNTSSGFIENINYDSEKDILIPFGMLDLFESYIKSVKLNGEEIKIWSDLKCDSWNIGDKKRIIVFAAYDKTILEELEIEIKNIIKDQNKRFKWLNNRTLYIANTDVHFIVNKTIKTSNFMSESSLKKTFPQYDKNSSYSYKGGGNENCYSKD